MFLDFQKAFDTVSHSLLLFKLTTLNIDETVFKWIECYLSQRTQTVVLNGKCSEYADVTSGVPQGSVLGLLLFLIYVNYISAGISSSIRLFVDDCVVYRNSFDHNDVLELQKDLSLIYSWCTKWKMNLNITKCVHILFTKKMKPFQSQYHLNNVQLKQESTYKYLGIILSSECSWRPQVDTLIAKAGKALNFIQRNLRCSHVNLKRMAYTTCIRPILEYGCVVWDPVEVTFIAALEQLQNRAARFVLGRYRRGESCTAMKAELGWECLSDRRQKQRLKFLYCIYYNKTGINREITYTTLITLQNVLIIVAKFGNTQLKQYVCQFIFS